MRKKKLGLGPVQVRHPIVQKSRMRLCLCFNWEKWWLGLKGQRERIFMYGTKYVGPEQINRSGVKSQWLCANKFNGSSVEPTTWFRVRFRLQFRTRYSYIIFISVNVLWGIVYFAYYFLLILVLLFFFLIYFCGRH